MPLWKTIKTMGELILIPTSQDEATARKACAIAQDIPGARWEIDGSVTGPESVLLTCRAASGEPIEWPSRLHRVNAPQLPDYQQWGAGFIRSQMGDGVMCNDDVGLGKTVQTIAALAPLPDVKVILCPAFLKTQWANEIAKWAPVFGDLEPKVAVLYPPSHKLSKVPPPSKPNWVVAFYTDSERALALVGYRTFVAVFDEGHNLRSMKSKRLEEVKRCAMFAGGRIMLTASPLYNQPARLHPMLEIVSPGHWGGFGAFARRYTDGLEGAYGYTPGKHLRNEEELKRRLSLYSFRRVREDVAAQLPFETKFQTVWLEAPEGVGGVHAALLGGLKGLAAHLRQVAEAKHDAIVETVSGDRESGIPSITFTWLREHAAKLADALPHSYLVLGGGDSSGRLDGIAQYVARCKATGIVPVVVGTMGALGEGANLQWAKVCNLAALDYTPDVLKQVIGRVARMGQSGEVTVRIFACRRTVDEHYIKVLTGKLGEQFKFDGRKEQAKADLADALQPQNVQDALRDMLERWKKEEARR